MIQIQQLLFTPMHNTTQTETGLGECSDDCPQALSTHPDEDMVSSEESSDEVFTA